MAVEANRPVQVLVLQSDLGRVTRTFGAWVSPSVK